MAPEHFVMILRSQISGKLADIAGNLPISCATDYLYFKDIVRQRFALTGEHYRKAFQNARKGTWQDSLHEAAAQMHQNFELWIKAEKAKTFQELQEVVFLEHFVSVLPEELAALANSTH